jgi:hypothetical protein
MDDRDVRRRGAALAALILIGTASGCNSSTTPNSPPASSIAVTPAALVFAGATSKVQQFVVTDPKFTGTFVESSTCANVATLAPVTNPPVGPTATWNVTPVAAGTCSVQFSDGTGATTATVAVNGPLSVNPTSLSFPSTSSVAQTVTVSKSGYAGSISESDTCAGAPAIATVSPSGSASASTGSATFSVTSASLGTCSITFGDSLGDSIVVPVGVL